MSTGFDFLRITSSFSGLISFINSHYNSSVIPCRLEMRIQKIISWMKLIRYNNRFSELLKKKDMQLKMKTCSDAELFLFIVRGITVGQVEVPIVRFPFSIIFSLFEKLC